MPYQQAVQPPKRPVGQGAIADTPADKTTPTGGTMQDCGRPAARGWGHGSHSISHPRGYQRWQVCSRSIRRVVCPPGRCPVGGASHHHLLHQHQREPSLNEEVGQGPPSRTLSGWWQTFTAVGGERTSSTY